MFFSVRDLELRSIPFDVSFAPGGIEFLDKKLRQSEPLRVIGEAAIANPAGEIRVRGHISGRIEFDCDRCLEAGVLEVDADFDLHYAPDEGDWAGHEMAISEEDSEMGFYEGDGLELAEVVREQVLLTLPMQRTCKPDCLGICPICWQNRNHTECQCRRQAVDPRWDALRSL